MYRNSGLLSGIFPTEIIFWLYRPLHFGNMIVRRSHNLSIPQLAASPSTPAEAESSDVMDEGSALHLAVDEMVSIYNAARAQGLEPHASWLRPNENFP